MFRFARRRNRYGRLLGETKFSQAIDLEGGILPLDCVSDNPPNMQNIVQIEHIGDEVDSGHYVCYLRKDETWVLADDTEVSKVPELQDMFKSKSYVLFYKREDIIDKTRSLASGQKRRAASSTQGGKKSKQ